MNNKNSVLLLALAVSTLFVGCKKETTTTVSNESVAVVAFPAEKLANTVQSGTNISNVYRLKGSIIAPGLVDLQSYGFIIKDFSNTYYPVGSGKKNGLIQLEIPYPIEITQDMIAFYVKFANGDSLRSDINGIIYGNSNNIVLPPPSVSIANYTMTDFVSGSSSLNYNLDYNQASGYFVNYSILYFRETLTNGSWYPMSLPPIPFLQDFEVLGGVMYSISGTLPNGLNYDFYVETEFAPPSSGSGLNLVKVTTPIITKLVQ